MRFPFVLNTHVPQSERPWAYEALFHTYLPLFEKIKKYPVTMGFSPQLIYEFTDKNFKKKAKAFFETIMKKISHIDVPHLKKYYTEFYETQYALLEKCQFNVSDLWKENNWEILAYPSTHCVMPLLSEKMIHHFLNEGESIIKDFFEVSNFHGIWMPEMAFEDGINKQRQILASKYKYIFGVWKTIHGIGSNNRIYQDTSGLELIIRNDRSQQTFWGNSCRIAGYDDFRESHRYDNSQNKIFRIGGGHYHPEDAKFYMAQAAEIMKHRFSEEPGDYCAIMFDTEYLGHYFWEGVEVFKKIISQESVKNRLSTCRDLIMDNSIERRPIDLEKMSYSWGTIGDDRSNANLESWVNGKTHKYLQYYREALIKLDKYDDNTMLEKQKYLRKLFASDWLFIHTFDEKQDIYDPDFNLVKFAHDKIHDSFSKI